MSETLAAYAARHAATVGRQVQSSAPPVWVPTLPDAEGDCLGALQRPSQPGTLPPVAIFPDARRIVTGHNDGSLVYWELEQGSQLWATPGAHSDGISDVAVAPDGRRVATASRDKHVAIWDAESGQRRLLCPGHEDWVYRVCWAPDGSRVASTSRDGMLRVWDAATGAALHVWRVHAADADAVLGLDWTPDGRRLATGDRGGAVRIWDAATGSQLWQVQPVEQMVNRLAWSPDGSALLVGFAGGTLLVLDGEEGAERWRTTEQCDHLLALAWSPDGRHVAAGHRYTGERLLKVWDAQRGTEARRFTFPEAVCYKLAWAPGGGYLASSHYDVSQGQRDVVRFWDVRDLVAPASAPPLAPAQPLTGSLRILPVVLAQLHRLGIHPPLALAADLLDLTGGHGGDTSLTPLAGAPGIQALNRLRWPTHARIGLVALLLHDLPFPEWEPLAGAAPTAVRDALAAALAGATIAPVAPDPPLAALRAASGRVDERLLSLLTLLGPAAVAAEPGLPLRLLPRVANLPALTSAQRKLLGVRVVASERSGEAAGHAGSGGAQVGGITLGSLDRTLRSLLLSQLALPPDLLTYRHLRRELLLRAPQVAEPPRLRPTVLLLDVSPPTFGPVEAITRLAAFVVARSLRAAGTPVLLVTPGDRGELVFPLEQAADLVELWTARTLSPIDPVRNLRLAAAVRTQLRDESGLEPIILLLTQPWFGADDDVPPFRHLRGLFVQYPGYQVQPALAAHCERWHSLPAGQTNGLADLLGHLVG